MRKKLKIIWKMFKQFISGNYTLHATINSIEDNMFAKQYGNTPKFPNYKKRIQIAHRNLDITRRLTPKINYNNGMIYFLIEQAQKCLVESNQIIMQLEKKLQKGK